MITCSLPTNNHKLYFARLDLLPKISANGVPKMAINGILLTLYGSLPLDRSQMDQFNHETLTKSHSEVVLTMPH